MSSHPPKTNIFLAYVNLARVRIVVMVMVACAIGFVIASHGFFQLSRFLWALFGTALLSAGSCALNCYIERNEDALMPRTSGRPIPAGVIEPGRALAFGISCIVLGCVSLAINVNWLSVALGLVATVVYLAIYTPAKKITWWNTSIGAIPGAIPPLIGWAAVRGELDLGGWILFAMLFLWQHTHFFPIAWLYKDDYQKGGFRMLPVLEATGKKTFFLTVVSALILLPLSMMLYAIGSAGIAYCFSAGLFGVLLIGSGFRLVRNPSRAAARSVLFLSLFYLPAIFAAVVLDRYGSDVGQHIIGWLETVWRWT